MFFAPTELLPHAAELAPHRIGVLMADVPLNTVVPHTMLVPHTILVPHTMLLAKVIVVLEVVLLANIRYTPVPSGVNTACGEMAGALATSVFCSAALISR